MLLNLNSIKYFETSEEEINFVQELLKNESLPYLDIETHFNNFLIAKNMDKIVATIGMEIYQKKALLRSFAVLTQFRKKGIGQTIFNLLLKSAGRKNIQTIYLMTETAEAFFAKNGFQIIERKNIPTEISETNEFKFYCPASAITMVKNIT